MKNKIKFHALYFFILVLLIIIPACKSNNNKYHRIKWGGVELKKTSSLKSPVWVLGDSYCSYLNNRWPYYFSQTDTLGNFLFNKIAGAKSYLMYSYLEEDLKQTTPKFLVWTLGMNDNTHFEMPALGFYLWKYYVIKVESLCVKKHTTLIVCTIPNVPARDNTKKNEYIRQNFKNYIDFDSLVNNGVNKSWRKGWLDENGKGYHPTKLGAKKMAVYFKKRFSEITHYKY